MAGTAPIHPAPYGGGPPAVVDTFAVAAPAPEAGTDAFGNAYEAGDPIVTYADGTVVCGSTGIGKPLCENGAFVFYDAKGNRIGAIRVEESTKTVGVQSIGLDENTEVGTQYYEDVCCTHDFGPCPGTLEIELHVAVSTSDPQIPEGTKSFVGIRHFASLTGGATFFPFGGNGNTNFSAAVHGQTQNFENVRTFARTGVQTFCVRSIVEVNGLTTNVIPSRQSVSFKTTSCRECA